MITPQQRPRRNLWPRLVLTVAALPLALLLMAASLGAGNLLLGAAVFIPCLYLFGSLSKDLMDVWSGRYRDQPRYLFWWLLAVVPAGAWLLWLQLHS